MHTQFQTIIEREYQEFLNHTAEGRRSVELAQGDAPAAVTLKGPFLFGAMVGAMLCARAEKEAAQATLDAWLKTLASYNGGKL